MKLNGIRKGSKVFINTHKPLAVSLKIAIIVMFFAPACVQAAIDGWSKIEAEKFSSSSVHGFQQKGSILSCNADKNWLQFDNVDFHAGTKYIKINAANGDDISTIQVLINGQNFDTLTIGNTGSWDTYHAMTLKLNSPLNGVKDVKFVFLKGKTNVDWLTFLSDSTLDTNPRYRVVISTDFPPLDVCMSGCAADHSSDPDDVQSMVRFLLYSNEFDVEGLIASSATFANRAKKQNILDIINLYEKVYVNLRSHDTLFPSPDYLRSVTFQGRSGTWGGSVNSNTGAGKDSEASDSIISIVDKPDPRPIWFCFWGDCSNLAQAIWKVQNTRSAAELQTFLSKIRIYQIAHQDNTIDWLLNNFPDLFIIYSESTYMGIFGGPNDPLGNLSWLNTNIRQNHGPLGAIYPPAAMGVDGLKEGDSPSFMYLVSAAHGMNDPEDPAQESWGGQYKRSGSTNHWVDGQGGSSISKWKSEYQAEFAERADWMLPSSTSGQKESLTPDVRLFPNPVLNTLSVISDEELVVEIYDISGIKVLSSAKKQVDVSQLVDGIYLAKIFDSNKKLIKSEKIVKQ
jgi:hypothetical protein